MIIKSNSGGNLAEDKNKNKFSYRNQKDENDLEYSSKSETRRIMQNHSESERFV